MEEKGISCGSEEILELPTELVKNCHGFAMDMGGSLLKIIYRAKADQEENNNNKGTSKLRLVAFTRATQIPEALKYLKERCLILRSKDNEKPCMLATGVGCHLFSKDINDALDVKLQIKMEFECFIKAFLAVSRQLDDYLYPVCEDAIAMALKEKNHMIKIGLKHQELLKEAAITCTPENVQANSLSAEETKSKAALTSPIDSEVKENSPDKNGTTDDNKGGRLQFPCILAMLGSGVAHMVVKEDGSFTVVNSGFRAGRMLIGMGRLLTGAKNFDTLISMAAIGDNANVDTFMSALITADNPDSEPSFYGIAAENEDMFDCPIYCFGRGIEGDIDHFKKEDLARALVNTICLDVVDIIVDSVRISQVPRVYICGGMASSSLIRSIITLEVERKRNALSFFQQSVEPIGLHFLRKGALLGALGAFLLNEEKPKSEK